MPPDARERTPELDAVAKKDESLWDGFHGYPSQREGRIPYIKTAANWIEGRRLDDNYGPYWRVRNGLYDLSDWMDRHPGGSEWLRITRGTDITESFVSSHLDPSVEKILAKFHVRDITTPRNSPYTLDDDGFYMTLKRNVQKHLKENPLKKTKSRSVAIQDGLLAAFAVTFVATAYSQSPWMAVLCGAFLFLNVNCAHNFFHQRDSWRMYIWDLSMISSYEWRITHALSHHIYTNTIFDFELSGFEPFLDFKVYRGKNLLQRRMMGFLVHLILPLFFLLEFLKRIVTIAVGWQRLRPENLLPIAELLVLVVATSQWSQALLLFSLVQFTASYFFGAIGVVVGHHHPDLFHSGDQYRYGKDWGLCQLDSVRERHDIDDNLLLTLLVFGNHALHHLFPTVDHGQLHHLEDVFRTTCQTFAIDDYQRKQRPGTWSMIVGTFGQLARVSPRKDE